MSQGHVPLKSKSVDAFNVVWMMYNKRASPHCEFLKNKILPEQKEAYGRFHISTVEQYLNIYTFICISTCWIAKLSYLKFFCNRKEKIYFSIFLDDTL